MSASLFDWYKGMTPKERGVVIIGLLGIGTFATISIINGIKNKNKQQQAQAEVVGFVKDLDTLSDQGVKPSFQQSQYQQWADSIAKQFEGCDTSSYVLPWTGCSDPTNVNCYSNSGQTVFNIISQFDNNADFLALQAAFGTRTYDGCPTWFSTVKNVTLSAAIADELNTAEITNLNTVLKSLGISYSF